MASAILSIQQLRAVVASDLSDDDLIAIIDDEEAQLIERLGDHGDGVTAFTQLVSPIGCQAYVDRRILAIVTVADDESTVASDRYRVWKDEGRIEHKSGDWVGPVEIEYIPRDDRSARRRALIDLVRLVVERTAMKSESVAGEYSYSADDWEKARSDIYGRLILPQV